MNLRDTVRNALLKHPSIFENALTVYNHLFCVLGNGYEWLDGELILGSKEPISLKEAVKDRVKYSFEQFMTSPISKLIENKRVMDKYREQLITDIDRMFNVTKFSKDFTIPEKFTFYPTSRFSKMCCFPKNIKPDWKEGIVKLIEIMENNPDLVEDEDLWIPKVKERLKMT